MARRGARHGGRIRRRAGVTLVEVLIAVTLLAALSVAMLMSLQVALQALHKTNEKLLENRRVAGAQRILLQELEGLVPVLPTCAGGNARGPHFVFFQAEPQSMRLVSTFSLQEGWRGLVEGMTQSLALADVKGIVNQGGTILGTSRTNPFKKEGAVEKCLATFKKLGLDALVALGGEDTLGVAARFFKPSRSRGGLVGLVGGSPLGPFLFQ